jgi:hypothetical protein
VQAIRCLVSFLIFAAISGCHQSASPARSEFDRTSRPKQPLDASSDLVIAGLTKGMAYAELRKLALRSGWEPVVDAECNSNVVGSNYPELCSTHPDLDDCHVCEDLPELSSCSGDGYCGMSFKHGSKSLDVTTYGMIEDRFVSGKTSRLEVMGWEIKEEKAP